MIQVFLAILLAKLIGTVIFGFYCLSIFIICLERYYCKEKYSKQDFILDLIIPFRYFFKKFLNLFKD